MAVKCVWCKAEPDPADPLHSWAMCRQTVTQEMAYGCPDCLKTINDMKAAIDSMAEYLWATPEQRAALDQRYTQGQRPQPLRVKEPAQC